MNAIKPMPSGETITVRACGSQRYYAGFGGTFAILADSLVRKQALPGFYDVRWLKYARLEANTLHVVIQDINSDEELWSILDVAVKNSGAFPCTGPAPAAQIIDARWE